MASITQTDAGNFFACALDAGRLHAEVNADTRRRVPFLKIFRDLGGDGPRHHPRPELDHIDLEPLGTRGRGKFETNESRADHRNMPGRADTLPQRLALVENA